LCQALEASSLHYTSGDNAASDLESLAYWREKVREEKFGSPFPGIAAYSTLRNPEVTETRHEIYRIALRCK
jgi:hypothetical protein